MLGSNILEVAIGVIFVYLFISLICTTVNETVASLIQKRGKNLFLGIKNLLNDPDYKKLAQQLYNHGLVDSITKGAASDKVANRPPSYMPANTFTLALMDILGSRGIAESLRDYQDAAHQKQAELEAAQAGLNANPAAPGLQAAVTAAQVALTKAKSDLDKATEAKNLHDAAVKAAGLVKGFADVQNGKAASTALERALAAGRDLAVEHPDPLGNIRKAVENLNAGHTQESLLVIIDKARREAALLGTEVAKGATELKRLEANIEQWFNEAMDRVGGWYKRWTQVWLFVLAGTLVIFSNADTLMLVTRFTKDGPLLASVTASAQQIAQKTTDFSDPGQTAKLKTDVKNQADVLKLPLYWSNDAGDSNRYPWLAPPSELLGEWIRKIIGLALSVFAVSLGAPFWFDTLSKFVNLRGAGTPPGETKKSAPQRSAT